jgi:hypothetical protein
MNDIIKERLAKCSVAQIPEYDDNTTRMIIPKASFIPEEWITGRCYLIKLENYIVNPPDNFNLHEQWNNGIVPKHHYMKCEVVNKMGKMIKVEGIGFDIVTNTATNDFWSGWLPKKSIKKIEEIK